MREIPVECGGPDSPGGPAGPRTAGDAALAARLQAEEDAVAKAAAPRGRRRPRSPPSEPPDELPPLVDSPAASPSPRAERPPSAPPLTREAMGADWAEEWWAQQPGAGADDSPLAQPLDEDDQQGVGGDAWRRQQLAADEALARQLYAEEVQQLSERDRGAPLGVVWARPFNGPLLGRPPRRAAHRCRPPTHPNARCSPAVEPARAPARLGACAHPERPVV